MLEVYYTISDIGDRTENLDRSGHYNGKNWSLSYVIDGFEVCEPHYVDILEKELESLILSLPSKTNEQILLSTISKALTNVQGVEGKASVAFVICVDNIMSILTAGDTRVYLLDSNERTIDDSVAQKIINEGKSPSTSLNRHPLRKYLLKNIHSGCDDSDLTIKKYENLENLIICSDGVWSRFKDDKDFFISAKEGGNYLFNKAKNNINEKMDNMTILYLSPYKQ